MKIVIFDDLHEGGAKRVVYEQVKFLSKNHQVYYFTNKLPTSFVFEQYTTKIEHYNLTLPNFSGLKRLMEIVYFCFKIWPEYIKINKDINGLKPDLVIVHPSMLTQAPVLLLLLSVKTIYYAEEWLRIAYEPELAITNSIPLYKRWYEVLRRKLITWVDKTAIIEADLVITNSKFSKENLFNAYGVDAIVNYPGVDVEIFKPSYSDFKKEYFLYLGNKDKANGYDLIEKLEKNQSYPLRIKTIFATDDKFRIDEKRLVELYQNAAGVLCLGRNEPFGMVAIEAMACGTPVIALDLGGYKETIENEVTGWLIPDSVDDLKKWMMKLATQKELAVNMGKKGRQRVMEKFSWKQHGNKLNNHIMELIND